MYGNAPKDLGLIDLSPTEMMFWLYCPIKVPGKRTSGSDADPVLPENLEQFDDIVFAVYKDLGPEQWRDSYIYLSAKVLHQSEGKPMNRLGWHTDGFGTDDLNYVWYDKDPTVFYVPMWKPDLPTDHRLSMQHMSMLANHCPPDELKRYPCKHLLRLDSTVIHAVEPDVQAGVRAFVKVSVSKERYALQGNSVNHQLDLGWTYEPRAVERNCPIKGIAA